jgi:dienelactone hydrolase
MSQEYQQMRKQLQELFDNKDFEGAVSQAKKIKEKFADDPDHYVASYFNLSFFQASCKQIDNCVTTLEEGFTKGIWWTEETLKDFINYDLLKANERFKAILQKFNETFKKEKELAKLEWVVRTPDDYNSNKSYPLLISLHWGNSSPETFEQYWKIAVDRGFILVLPQSSQLSGFKSYTWMNLERGIQDLKKTYKEICDIYNIDIDEVYLAGASIGGKLAIEAVMSISIFPINGVIAVIPHDINPEALKPRITSLENDLLKICIVTGTDDPSNGPSKKLYQILQENNIDSRFYESVGTGHIFPDDFDTILEETIAFFLKN